MSRPPSAASNAAVHVFLVFTMCSSGILLNALLANGPFIRAALGLTQVAFGLLPAIAFGSAVVFSLVMRSWISKTSVAALVVLFYGAAILSTAIATVFGTLASVALGLVFTGLALAIGNPLTNRVIMERLDARVHGVAAGAKQSGGQIAQFCTGAGLPALVVLLGWRFSFALIEILPVLTLLFGVFVAKTFVVNSRGHSARASAPQHKALPQRADSDSSRTVIWLVIYTASAGAVQQSVNTYLSLYVYDNLGFSSIGAGLIVAFVAITSMFGRLYWSWRASRQGTYSSVLVGLAIAGAASCVLLAVSDGLRSGAVAWVAGAVAAVSSLSLFAVIMATVIHVANIRSIGSMSARVASVQFLAAVVSPPLFGMSVEHVGYQLSWLLLAAVALLGVVSARALRSSLRTAG